MEPVPTAKPLPNIKLDLTSNLLEMLQLIESRFGPHLYIMQNGKLMVSSDYLKTLFPDSYLASNLLHFTKFVYKLRKGVTMDVFLNNKNRLNKNYAELAKYPTIHKLIAGHIAIILTQYNRIISEQTEKEE